MSEELKMKWSRKTKEFQYADYISENGLYKIRDMSINDSNRYAEHIKNGGKKQSTGHYLTTITILFAGVQRLKN